MLLVLAVLLTAGCSGRADKRSQTETTPRFVATDMAFTVTKEVWFGDRHVGFVVDVLAVPDGFLDQRPYKAGTLVVEDLTMFPIGFISPRGSSYAFDANDEAKLVAFGGRDSSVARFFKANGMPRYIVVAGDPHAQLDG
jgi:hypothetical protein